MASCCAGSSQMRPNPRRSGRLGSGSLDGDWNAILIHPVVRFGVLSFSRRDMHARAYLGTHIRARNREAAGERQKAEKKLMMAGYAEQNRGGLALGVSRARNPPIAAS